MACCVALHYCDVHDLVREIGASASREPLSFDEKDELFSRESQRCVASALIREMHWLLAVGVVGEVAEFAAETARSGRRPR